MSGFVYITRAWHEEFLDHIEADTSVRNANQTRKKWKDMGFEVSTVKLPAALWSRDNDHVTAEFFDVDGNHVHRPGRGFW